MINKAPLSFLVSVALCFPVPLSQAATRQEYSAATIDGLREQKSFGRAKGMVSKVLGGSKDGKIAVLGRGEIMIISQLLLAGRQNNDAEMLGLARDIVLACNKAALDGYDTPELTSLEQIGFSLRELGLAVPQLKELKLLTGTDASRADETLKKAADFLIKFRPDPGDGNIMQRYALGIATVCSLFPNDPRVPQWKAWAAKPFLHLLHFPDQKGFPGEVRRVFEKQGDRWKLVPDTAPFKVANGVDISEDSSSYQASTIVSWMGIARLLGRENEIKTPEVEAFIERFYQQILPLGILPTYGDADWNGAPAEWIAIFEWAGATFHEPKYRAAADAILRYQTERGLLVGDLSEASVYADESIQPVPASRSSVLLQRLSGRGERVPDKVILRGNETKGTGTQPYVMMQCTESYGHSHPYAASISAYCAGGAMLLNSLGYDATATPLHQSFMVRPPDESFLQLFGDPNGTRIAKIMPDGQRLTSKIISDTREVRGAEVRDEHGMAYGKVVCDYLTAWQHNRRFNGHAFVHTRELALDKATGLLCVLDTIESKDDVLAAFGPIWHVGNVLAKNDQGFLCQSKDIINCDGRVIGVKAQPVWVAMSGPADTKLNDVFWKLSARQGNRIAQEHHMTADWSGSVKAGQKLSFLTVFVPLPEGTTEPPDNLKLNVETGRASVTFGNFHYVFPGVK